MDREEKEPGNSRPFHDGVAHFKVCYEMVGSSRKKIASEGVQQVTARKGRKDKGDSQKRPEAVSVEKIPGLAVKSAHFPAGRKKQDRGDDETVQELVCDKKKKSVLGKFELEAIFEIVLHVMDRHDAADKKPHEGHIEVGKSNDDHKERVNHHVEEMAQLTADLQLIELFKLENEISEEMRKVKFQEEKHRVGPFAVPEGVFFPQQLNKCLACSFIITHLIASFSSGPVPLTGYLLKAC